MRARLSRWIRAALTGSRLWRRRVEGNGSAFAPVWCVVANVIEDRRYGAGGEIGRASCRERV